MRSLRRRTFTNPSVDPDHLAGDARGIIRRCHEGKGAMWVSSRWCDDGWQHMWFLPSGRKYPTDASRPTISATMIRKVFGTTPSEEIGERVKDLVMKPGELAKMLELRRGVLR